MPASEKSSHFYYQLSWWTRFRLRFRRKARIWSSGIAVTVVVAGISAAMLWLPKLAFHAVSGRVECSSGAPVVGVYIRDSALRGSDFANWTAVPDRPSVARYSHAR